MSKKKFRFDGISEATVCALLYHELKLAGFDSFLEVPAYSKVHRSAQFKIDCLVVKNGQSVCAIEVKTENAKPSGVGRQASAYNGLGMPWRYCIGKREIPSVLDWVRFVAATSPALAES